MIEDMKEYKRQWYERNRADVLEKQAVRNKKLRAEKQAYVQDLKTKTPCADCGINYHYAVMDFDHLSDKVDNICRLISGNEGWGRLKAEIAKCEIVCANCHRMRTFTRHS
jgi:hypothetical protein